MWQEYSQWAENKKGRMAARVGMRERQAYFN
jgi:hypothetical protein